ncbi:MAG TPA: chromate transporter [Candidatus Cloacimonadota bacterium]|nr:chromate transporter [Candidatus Cloacimonadota bacterium]HPS39850.1 chromate transporter [Candidatus Cloacimonadota bacterium]
MSEPNKASLLKLFVTFFKIGAFTIGGAYAMIPLIRTEVVQKNGWLRDEDFLDGIAAAQSCPGPIAANISVYIGFRLRRTLGMLTALLGTILPSFITILVIAMFFDRVSDLAATERVFHALRPAVVALIAIPVIQMSKTGGVSLKNFWFPLTAAILVGVFNLSPIWLILVTVVFAVLTSVLPFWRKERMQ